MQYQQTKALPVHESMAKVSHTHLGNLQNLPVHPGQVPRHPLAADRGLHGLLLQGSCSTNPARRMCIVILLASVLGILGSYGVAWFGIRINTVSNSRTAFSALKGNPLGHPGHSAPLRHERRPAARRGGIVLHDLHPDVPPQDLVGPCFIGFAIGESLGASVLRICGGIFTKIADIGSDLMKIVFKLPEDDPKNPGVIADCTGDNAGDSVGPTADGFETYGVTGVALIAFLALALAASPTIVRDADHLAVRHARADDRDLAGFLLRQRRHQQGHVRRQERLRFRSPADAPRLDHLGGVHRASPSSPANCCWATSRTRTGVPQPALWWVLSAIISCGTVAGALIPEFTKIFVSTNFAARRAK